jgi:hypothetical protein
VMLTYRYLNNSSARKDAEQMEQVAERQLDQRF